MYQLKKIADSYLVKYNIEPILIVRILLVLIALVLMISVRGTARRISVFTCVVALIVTFVPEMITVYKIFAQSKDRYI